MNPLFSPLDPHPQTNILFLSLHLLFLNPPHTHTHTPTHPPAGPTRRRQARPQIHLSPPRRLAPTSINRPCRGGGRRVDAGWGQCRDGRGRAAGVGGGGGGGAFVVAGGWGWWWQWQWQWHSSVSVCQNLVSPPSFACITLRPSIVYSSSLLPTSPSLTPTSHHLFATPSITL
jgi:hypothetical protein